MTKHFLYLLIAVPLLLLAQSCEYSHTSRLENKSGETVNLTIHFNKTWFNKRWESEPYTWYLKAYGAGPGVTLKDFDTVKLISHYCISNNSTFSIDQPFGARKIKPDYRKFKLFRVETKNGPVILRNQKAFEKLFVTKDDIDYTWTLK